MRRPAYAILAAALFLVPVSLAAQRFANESQVGMRFGGATATYSLLLTGVVVLFGVTWLQRRHSSELA